MKIKNINDLKKIKSHLEIVNKYLEETKIFFKELDKILNNIDLSDTDKVIMINNQYKELENRQLTIFD